MIEVFKTNVQDREQSQMLLDQIHSTFADHTANFDLSDCDKILRVKCGSGRISPDCLIALLEQYGYAAEVLQE